MYSVLAPSFLKIEAPRKHSYTMSASSLVIKDFRSIPGTLADVPDDGTLTPRDGNAWVFPAIKSVNAHGRLSEWVVFVRLIGFDGKFVQIQSEYLDNGDMPLCRGWIKVNSGVIGGKIRATEPTIVSSGKNIGRANQTNVFCQALRDAYSLYNKQLKKADKSAMTGGPLSDSGSSSSGVSLGPSSGPNSGTAAALGLVQAPSRPLPMLASKAELTDIYHEIVFVQKKYNGVRTVMTLENGEVIAYSRRAQPYPGCQLMKKEVKPYLELAASRGDQLSLDGEIYAHGVALQVLSGYMRRLESEDMSGAKYILYDCFIAGRPHMLFKERFDYLVELFGHFEPLSASEKEGPFVDKRYPAAPPSRLNAPESVMMAVTYKFDGGLINPVDTKTDIAPLYEGFLADGYEGAMIRLNQTYRHSANDHHCSQLLKLKPTQDKEYLITGYTVGKKGKAAGALMMICQTENGTSFNVTPAMPLAERIQLAADMENIGPDGRSMFAREYLGRWLTVTFDELSKTQDVPQRARTSMVIRDDL